MKEHIYQDAGTRDPRGQTGRTKARLPGDRRDSPVW